MRSKPACNRASVSSRFRGLVPIGYQASPSRAVRRIAGPLSPPTHTGIRCCTGRGWKKTFENLAYLPLKLGFSLLHSSRQTAIVSSVTAPRSANGSVPIASNSSWHQPTPMPQMKRPSDSTSIVAMVLAVQTGGSVCDAVDGRPLLHFLVVGVGGETRDHVVVRVAPAQS